MMAGCTSDCSRARAADVPFWNVVALRLAEPTGHKAFWQAALFHQWSSLTSPLVLWPGYAQASGLSEMERTEVESMRKIPFLVAGVCLPLSGQAALAVD